jgi:hypothetical protein
MSEKMFVPQETERTKEQTWNAILNDLDRITDRLGTPIDPEIKETLAGCIANGFPTKQSCGGHVEKDRLRLPFVSIVAQHEPRYEYVGQESTLKALAGRFGVSEENIWDHPDAERLYDEQMEKYDWEHTPEYRAWEEEQSVLMERLKGIVQEFNRGRETSHPLSVEHYQIVTLPTLETLDIVKGRRPTPPNFEQMIREAQKEMKDFGEFLKQRFFTTP